MQLQTFGTWTGAISGVGAGALTASPETQYLAPYLALASAAVWVAMLIWFLVSNRREIRSGVTKLGSWYFIIPCLALGVLALASAAYGLGLRSSSSLESGKPQDAAASQPARAARASTHVSIETLKIPAPYYNKTDVDKVLDATREISELLQLAITVRDSAQEFAKTWNGIILSKGEPAARSRLKEVRMGAKSIADKGWEISNKYSHYNEEIGPILSGMNFYEKFAEQMDRFTRAIEKLRPDVDAGTLSLLEPVRADYQTGISLFQKWMSDTDQKNREETEKFRRFQKAEK